MLCGVGTDFMCVSRMQTSVENAAFLSAVYTADERAQAGLRDDPLLYYAARYAAKEAVFKCFGQVPGEIRLNEIEVLDGENGKPFVTLTGSCFAHSAAIGITRIELSLSHDGGFVLAFAVAVGKD